MHIREEKERMRKSVKLRLERMDDSERQAESRTLCKELGPLIPKDAVIAAYYPLRTEADLRPLFPALLNAGIPIYLPRFEGDFFTFRKVEDFQALEDGEFSIPEPSGENQELPLSENVIALVPGRAFDRHCGRLGRGNGGFDIWIENARKTCPEITIWGIALECQMVEEVPREEHDMRVDGVMTARGLLNTDN